MPKVKGNYCNVEGCHNRSEDDKKKEIPRHYYRLPAVIKHQGPECEKLSEERRRLWLARLNQDFSGKNLDNVRVCSDHFVNGKKAELYQRDSPDWIPTVNMCRKMRLTLDTDSPRMNARYNRKIERQKKSEGAAALLEFSRCIEPQSEIEQEQETGIAVQTIVEQPLYLAMEDELQSLRTENIKVKELLLSATNKHTFDEFRDNDEKVKYFTGLPKFTVLWALFQFVRPKLPEKQCLDKFQFLILCLMRLRLDLPLQFLAFEFNISPSSVSRFFAECIDILYKRLKPSVRWPEREQLRKTMPMQFRKHFNNKVAVIIDCFEIFIERPSNLIARASTWSSYKHHHTAKYLVGITPQGSVSYISKGWGGRTSDKYITEHSGFLSNILPGDLILADRGFDIADSVGCLCAEAKIPAFTKGRDQLSPLDIENTRKLASCRIQVERVIGLVCQKYTLLSGTCSLEYMACKQGEELTQQDKIVVSACGLANLCPSVVDFN